MSTYLSAQAFAVARRRPRPTGAHGAKVVTCRPSLHETSAYVVSRPILLAAATMSLVVLKEFLPAKHPVSRLLRRGIYWQRRCERSIIRFVTHSRRQIMTAISPFFTPTRSSPPEIPSRHPTRSPQTMSEFSAQLDGVRDRAIAQLDNEGLVMSAQTAETLVSAAEFDALEPGQRRDLLANAFARVNMAATNAAVIDEKVDDVFLEDKVNRSADQFTMPTERTARRRPVDNQVKLAKKENMVKPSFWRSIESLNGRVAAVGFVLCLAREILEPGHPSLYDQVEDVLVPIAQSTPPFLVAVCDKIADLLT